MDVRIKPNELLAGIIEAHGGMDRWKGYEKVEATIVTGLSPVCNFLSYCCNTT